MVSEENIAVSETHSLSLSPKLCKVSKITTYRYHSKYHLAMFWKTSANI